MEVLVTQLRKQMLEELQRRNYSQTTHEGLPEDCEGLRQVLPPFAGPARARTDPRLSRVRTK
jgi:hypothetical protein